MLNGVGGIGLLIVYGTDRSTSQEAGRVTQSTGFGYLAPASMVNTSRDL